MDGWRGPTPAPRRTWRPPGGRSAGLPSSTCRRWCATTAASCRTTRAASSAAWRRSWRGSRAPGGRSGRRLTFLKGPDKSPLGRAILRQLNGRREGIRRMFNSTGWESAKAARRLTLAHQRGGPRDGLQALDGNGPAGHLAGALRALPDALEGAIELAQQVLVELVLDAGLLALGQHGRLVDHVTELASLPRGRPDPGRPLPHPRLDAGPLAGEECLEVLELLGRQHLSDTPSARPASQPVRV